MIRYRQILNDSVVDGLGIRVVVFFQGCVRCCEGCHNPELIPEEGGKNISEKQLAVEIIKRINPLVKGVTFSGGEPLMQAEALQAVIEELKRAKPDIDIWVYTGYVYESIQTLPLMPLIDVLVDGPFIQAEKDLSLPFRGSANQRLIDVKKTLKANRVVELELH